MKARTRSGPSLLASDDGSRAPIVSIDFGIGLCENPRQMALPVQGGSV